MFPVVNNISSNSSSPLPDIFFLAALSLHLLIKSTSSTRRCRLFLRNTNPVTSASMASGGSKPLRFPSPQSLSDWLKPRLPSDSLAAWGLAPGTKNLHNLWLELSQGETSLNDSSPPTRTVHVATIRILSPTSPFEILIESHQELSDGSVRQRLRPLSEKMKPGEGIEEAVRRAVREELGFLVPDSAGSVRIVPGSYWERVEERVSISYPGLPVRYVLHSVDAWVDGLPEGEFSTEEGGEYDDSEDVRVAVAEKAVFVKKHYWKWMRVNDSAV